MTPAATAPAPGPPWGRQLVVVGASGWIGGRVCLAAAARGLAVTPVSSRSGRPPDSWQRPLEELPALLRGEGTVLLNAAGATGGAPAVLQQANVDLCLLLARRCEDTGTPLITLGSAAEYGPPTSGRVSESHPEQPTSDYGRSKLAATQQLRERVAEGLVVTVARIFNVLGGGRRGRDPVQDFAAAVRALPDGGGVVEAWDSSLVRDLSSVDWVAERLVDLVGCVGAADTVNVCSGRPTRFRDLIVAMAHARGIPVEVRDTAPGGIPHIVGDPALLHRLTGLPPEESLETLARLALRES